MLVLPLQVGPAAVPQVVSQWLPQLPEDLDAPGTTYSASSLQQAAAAFSLTLEGTAVDAKPRSSTASDAIELAERVSAARM